jgi:hypothetical protein
LQFSGTVENSTLSSSPDIRVWGPGFGFYLEASPEFPPLRIYFNWKTWGLYEGKGYFKGTDTEFGVRGQYRGFQIWAGYRMEEFSGRAEHDLGGESRMAFKVNGPVLGIGVGF